MPELKGDPGLPPLQGSLDQPQASGAAQLDLAGRTPRAPLRDSNSARLNHRLHAVDQGGAQGVSGRYHPRGVGWVESNDTQHLFVVNVGLFQPNPRSLFKYIERNSVHEGE